MKNVSRNGKMRGIFLVSILIICTVAVLWRRFGVSDTKNPEQQQVRDSLYQQKRVLLYNTKVYSQAVRLANNGDIVVRLGTDTAGGRLLKMNPGDSTNSHAGIIMRENDTVFVYHAMAGGHNGFNSLWKEPLWKFGHPAGNKRLVLYRIELDSTASKRTVSVMRKIFRQPTELDPFFYYQETDKWKFFNTAFLGQIFESITQDTTLFSRSIVVDSKRYIGLTDLINGGHSKKIKSWEY